MHAQLREPVSLLWLITEWVRVYLGSMDGLNSAASPNPTIVWAMTPGAPHTTYRQVKGQSFLPTVLILRMVCVSLASFKNFLRLMSYFVRCLSFLDFLNLNFSLPDEMLNSEDAIMWPNGLPLTVIMWLRAQTLCLIMSFAYFTSLGEVLLSPYIIVDLS